jgi:hypothetical protein
MEGCVHGSTCKIACHHFFRYLVTMPVDQPHFTPASLKRIFTTWWPLAASWLLMGLELPALSAVIARLAEPEINLAAYGDIVFPLALIIESPIIMLLAASTALSKDQASYRKIWAFMMTISGVLTGLHLIIAFTPVYYFVAGSILGAPQEIIEPARIGLMIMTPWTWAIAYRRFNQGALIRYRRHALGNILVHENLGTIACPDRIGPQRIMDRYPASGIESNPILVPGRHPCLETAARDTGSRGGILGDNIHYPARGCVVGKNHWPVYRIGGFPGWNVNPNLLALAAQPASDPFNL